MRKLTLLATVAMIWPLMAHAQLSVPTSTPAVGASAAATSGDTGKEAAWKKLTPEEKAAKKAEFKQKWQAMTPEQKEQFKKDHPKFAERAQKREEKRAEWKAMTPEQKATKKAEFKNKFDSMTPEQQAAFKAKHPKFAEHNDIAPASGK